jgi:hypothetical protein
MLYRLGHVARFVTLQAFHLFVFSKQREIRQIMVERSTLANVLE